MHLVERYALSCGAKIDKPFVLDTYFPLPFDKYITVHFASKGSKTYDLAQDVIDLLNTSILVTQNIKLVQVGVQNERKLRGCYITNGQTSINQVAYLVKHAIAHIGVDSFTAHLAGVYDKPMVVLYSNNYKECCWPYWGDKKKQIFLEPDRTLKPSFAYEEYPKSINKIRPELIAKKLMIDLLGLPWHFPYRTVLVGDAYHNQLIESVPDQIVNPQLFGTDTMIVRMDYLFDEQVLIQQLQQSKCSIVTNRPINESILAQFKPNIRDVVYLIDENQKPEFVSLLVKYNIPYALLSYLPIEEINKLKLYYMDYGIIMPRSNQKPEFFNTEKLVGKSIFYQSSKITLSQGKVFPSRAAYVRNVPIETQVYTPLPIIDGPEFWQDIEYMHLYVNE